MKLHTRINCTEVKHTHPHQTPNHTTHTLSNAKDTYPFTHYHPQSTCTRNTQLHTPYARNTPGSICQYKEDVLVSRPPSLFTSMRRLMHGTSCPKSQLKSTCLTGKFGSFLDHTETGEKRQNVINYSVQHPISLIFCNPCFFYHTFTNDVDFVDKAYAEMCDHSLFTLQFR